MSLAFVWKQTEEKMEDILLPLLGAYIAMFAGFMIVAFILAIAGYIYLSLAFMKISQKANLTSPALAWIPGVGPLIQMYRISGMHWWPWLLLAVPLIAFPVMFIPIIGILASIIYFVAILTFAVFVIIWMWKTFEAVNKPGWWVLLGLIPGIGGLISLILIGVAAWSK